MGLQGIGAVVLVIGGLVFVHELGHFLVAKLLGVKVLRFSIGFGPRLLWWTHGETEYRISALPLGGYVKMAGDVPGEEPDPADRGRGFYEQRPWKRILIGFAGPASNFLFPILLFATAGFVQNGQEAPAAAIGYVLPGSAADRVGILPGDRIVSIAPPGEAPRPMRWWGDLLGVISGHPGDPLSVVIDRRGTHRTVEVVPDTDERWNSVEMERRGVLGIVPSYPAAVVVPAARGVAGPVEPFDEVSRVAGAPVSHYGDVARAFAAAGCAPVEVEVRRGEGEARGAVLLEDVPTCAGGRISVVPASARVAAVVSRVVPGEPAEAAGLARGDVVRAVDGHPVRTLSDVEEIAGGLKPGATLTLSLAGGQTIRYAPRTQLVRDPATGERVERLALGFEGAALELGPWAGTARVELGAGEIVASAVSDTWRLTRLTAVGIGRILTGKISHRQVGGIIELAKQSADAAAAGLGRLLFWMAVVSVNLGLMNLLPIPVLDGGHVVAALVEQVTHRPLSMRVREIATYVGLLLLGLLMILAFRNDIVRMMG